MAPLRAIEWMALVTLVRNPVHGAEEVAAHCLLCKHGHKLGHIWLATRVYGHGKEKPCYFPEYFSEVVLHSFAQIWPEQQETEDKPSGPVYSY